MAGGKERKKTTMSEVAGTIRSPGAPFREGMPLGARLKSLWQQATGAHRPIDLAGMKHLYESYSQWYRNPRTNEYLRPDDFLEYMFRRGTDRSSQGQVPLRPISDQAWNEFTSWWGSIYPARNEDLRRKAEAIISSTRR